MYLIDHIVNDSSIYMLNFQKITLRCTSQNARKDLNVTSIYILCKFHQINAFSGFLGMCL